MAIAIKATCIKLTLQEAVLGLLLLLLVPDAEPDVARINLSHGPPRLAPVQRVRPSHRVLHLMEDGQPKLVPIKLTILRS